MRNTSDFDGKRSSVRAIWDVYQRLSGATALVPPAIVFSLDQETRTNTEMGELKKISGGMIRFLPRRTYENYLLSSKAIAGAFSKTMETFQKKPLSPIQVQGWIDTNGEQPKYFKSGTPEKANSDLWKQRINTPKFLIDLVAALSETQENFDKLRDSIALTEWILANDPQELEELSEYLKTLTG